MARKVHVTDSGFDAELTRSSLPALLILATLAAIAFVAVAYVRIKATRERAALERLQQEDEVARDNIAKDVIDLQSRLGRLPESESELVTLLGRPMPKVHVQNTTVPIHYERRGQSFRLVHQSDDHDYRVFDGSNPTEGWFGIENF